VGCAVVGGDGGNRCRDFVAVVVPVVVVAVAVAEGADAAGAVALGSSTGGKESADAVTLGTSTGAGVVCVEALPAEFAFGRDAT